MAERTGLEPATLGVTGRYSNQLNYRSEIMWQDSRLNSTEKQLNFQYRTRMYDQAHYASCIKIVFDGGCCRDRTCDLRLVRAMLSQLS